MPVKDHNKRTVIVRIALILTAVLPVFIGIMQAVHYSRWLFDINYDGHISLIHKTVHTVPFLLFVLVISIYEKFCIFHRITLIATIYSTSSCFLLDIFPSVLVCNITNILAVLCIVAGIFGCAHHFFLQITDFIRYVRIKSTK